MALSLILSPASPNAAYLEGAAEFAYKDERSVTGTANNGGFLQLTVTGIGADVSVGDYVWYSELDGADDLDSPIGKITAEATNTITLDVAYDASYSGGNIRLMAVETFAVKTGYASTTAQPKRTSQTLSVRANPDGIYRVSCLPSVKTRFNWDEPRITLNSDYDHQVQAVAYPTSISEPSNIVLLKQRTGTSPQVPPISYSNFRGLISSVVSSVYKIYQESDKETTLLDGGSTVLRYILGNTVNIPFATSIADADTTVSPALPSGLSYTTTDAGQTLTGLQIASNADASTINGTYVVTFDNGVDPVIEYTVTLVCVDGTAGRTQCESKELTLVWWHPDGGWWQYSFELGRTFEITGNEATIVKNADAERIGVNYEEIVEGITLRAQPESEEILDALNTLGYSNQIFIASFTGSGGSRAIDLTNFERVFVEGGGYTQKNVNPYKAVQNDFQITVYKSAEVVAINQG